MVAYKLFAEHRHNDEYGDYEAFGIIVSEPGGIVRVVEDVCTDKNKAEALVSQFNKERLLPCHLDEAIEDYLYDFEI